MLIAPGQDVFGPDDIYKLETALKSASEHFRNAYGFDGRSLRAAETIAASAIFRHWRNGVHTLTGLIEAATEAVRQWLKGERIVKGGNEPAVPRLQGPRTRRQGFVWVSYKRLFSDSRQLEALLNESEQSTLH